ncbi:hypothetical protein DFH07DRAFT_826956 [Mycena maculata]|uniref:FAD-binding domain-containing protein n=1 Tax=Mycena maculata TaxID=230809 RepID=A0AAD7N949_9AGAR|nr:hypothetical protein DFH07DRAFT_826956 [Mycena maculata]
MSSSHEPGLKFVTLHLNPASRAYLTSLFQIVVGASIAGLTSAIALKSAGHSVVVLEREPQLGGPDSIGSGGARVPPNGCKVLFDWGLETDLRAGSVVGNGFLIFKYDHQGKESGRDCIGLNLWDPQLLVDARGDFLHMRHRDLLRILYNAATKDDREEGGGVATSSEVTVLFNAEVIDIDCDICSVTLRSGETHVGDVIIGADGASGVIRKCLMREESNGNAVPEDVPTGLAVYSTVIPKTVAVDHEELRQLYEYPQSNTVVTLLGNNRGAKVFLAGKDQDVLVWVYTPNTSQAGSWTQQVDKPMRDIVGPCDSLLQTLAAQAGTSTCVQIKNHYELKSWVSQSGKVVAIGEAAHPFPPISLHTCSIAIEDGAFIGKIFSHTRSPTRISEFLHAFEENRKTRCAYILQSEQNNLDFIVMPDGEKQVARDALLRANQAAGRNVMDAPEEEMHKIWDDMRIVFSYDPSDAADEWWVSWGRLRDAPSAKASG